VTWNFGHFAEHQLSTFGAKKMATLVDFPPVLRDQPFIDYATILGRRLALTVSDDHRLDAW